MSTVDIYSDEHLNTIHSLHYIHIVADNTIGILNRIASLMRRKRYNMEEVSVSFDTENNAHIIVAIDSRQIDQVHVMKQLEKLHDVSLVEDVTFQYDKLYNSISVRVDHEEEFQSFPVQPNRIIKRSEKVKGVFIVTLEETLDLMKVVHEGGYSYRRQIIGLI